MTAVARAPLGRRRGFARWAALALAVPAALLVSATASAQAGPGLSFIGGIGYEQGGPGPDLVAALEAGHLDGVRPATCAGPYCQPPVEYPFHFREGIGLALTLGFRYRFPGPISIEALASNGQRGHAEGFDDRTNEHLIVSYSSYMLGTTLGVHLGPVRLGAGPAFLSTGWTAIYNSSDREKSTTVEPGGRVGVSYNIRVAEAVVSVRASVQDFARDEVSNQMDVPIRTHYRTFTVGVAVNPWAS